MSSLTPLVNPLAGVIPSDEPLKVAHHLMDTVFRSAPLPSQGHPTLVHYRNDFFLHEPDRGWHVPSTGAINAMVWAALEDAQYSRTAARSTQILRLAPNQSKVNDYLHALAAVCRLHDDSHLPQLLTPLPCDPPTAHLLVFRDRTIDLLASARTHAANLSSGGTVTPGSEVDLSNGFPTTPRLLSLGVLPCDFAPSSPCPRWEQALQEWSGNDAAWIESVERMIAYALLPTRRFAKWFLLEGQSRAGKGTILRVIRALMSRVGTVSTDLNHMSSNFGLSGLQYARVLTIPEVNLVSRQASERCSAILKLCVGEDLVTIDIKFQPALRNILIAAVPILCSNQIPVLANKSSGLSSKLIPIPFDISFSGREDPDLSDKLLAELPGIAHRVACAGVRLLSDHLRGIQPFALTDRAKGRLRSFHLANNAADEFLTARFRPVPEGRVPYSHIRAHFNEWKETNKIRMPHIPDNRFGVWLVQNSSWLIRTAEWGTAESKTYGIRGIGYRPDYGTHGDLLHSQ